MTAPFADCCARRHEHEHVGAWVLMAWHHYRNPNRRPRAERWGYTIDRQPRVDGGPMEGFTSKALYGSKDAALAAGRADAEACA